MQNAPRSLLVIDVAPFGRSLALLPAARALRSAFPKSFIAAAAATGTCELLNAGGFVDETIDLGVIKQLDGSGAFKRLLRLARRARHFEFDLVIDSSPRVETQLLSRFVVRARVVTPSRLPNLLDLLLGGKWRRGSNASGYAALLRQVGVEMNDGALRVIVPAEQHARFEKLLAGRGYRGGEPLVVLYSSNPSDPTRWPVDYFAEVGKRLAHNFGARAVVVDEPSDKSFTAAVYKALPPNSIKMAEPSALELAAALARASVVVTDDPGVGLLCDDLGAPVVEVSDARPAGSAPRTHRVVHGSSLARVQADEVYEAACEMLQDSRSASLFNR